MTKHVSKTMHQWASYTQKKLDGRLVDNTLCGPLSHQGQEVEAHDPGFVFVFIIQRQ